MMHPKTRIDRYLSAGLAPERENKLRSHMGECADCRSYYDQQVVLLRALSGAPEKVTAAEDERIVSLVLRSTGQALKEHDSRPALPDRLVWAPLPLLAAVAALLLVFLAVAWQWLAPGEEEMPADATVAARLIKGKGVVIDGTPVKSDPSSKVKLLAGDRIEVGQRGVAELELKGGGTVRMFPGTSVTFAGSGERLDLSNGKVWCLVDRKRSGHFFVRTATAEAWVIGTSFVVEHREGGVTEVRVMKGTVAVTDRSRPAPILVKKKQKIKVTPGENPGRPVSYAPRKDKSDWDRFIEMLVRFFRSIGEGIESLFE